MKDSIVIDTDPGVDDTLAMIFSSCSQLPVDAITTVYGNSSIDNVTRNAGYVIEGIPDNWELFKGAKNPIKGRGRLAKSHGRTGLGKIQPTESEIKKPNYETALEYLTSFPVRNKITMFCLGPLTNLAQALQSKPNLLQDFQRLLIMCGAFSEKGNVTEFAEFNTYNDPEAAALVLNTAYQQQTNTVIIPVEVCRKVMLTNEDLRVLQDANLLPNLSSVIEPFIDYYMNNKNYGGYKGAVFYDVLVPLYYLYPELFKTIASKVNVELDSTVHRGRTTSLPDDKSSIKVCIDIDAAKAKELIMTSLLSSVTIR